MKMPNLPSRYQAGTSNRSSDGHAAANGPAATALSTVFRMACAFGCSANGGSGWASDADGNEEERYGEEGGTTETDNGLMALDGNGAKGTDFALSRRISTRPTGVSGWQSGQLRQLQILPSMSHRSSQLCPSRQRNTWPLMSRQFRSIPAIAFMSSSVSGSVTAACRFAR